MFPGVIAATTPDKPAIIDAARGLSLTYRELDDNSARLANHLEALGLRPGDTIAMVSRNDLHMFEVYWAALRSGLYVTAVNHHLTADETDYILTDSAAQVVFADATVSDAVSQAGQIPALAVPGHRIAWGGSIDGFDDYDAILAAAPDTPRTGEPRGTDMLYSSGTTGRPKGIRTPLPVGNVAEVPDAYTAIFGPMYGFDSDSVYLSPAPLYHAAPLRFCGVTNSTGGTVVFMDHFDPIDALQLIEEYRVTHSQWVPTMFIRMLKLPEDVRTGYDVSSLKVAIHAAAPCPAEVKRAMIEWWGPVIYEYYASTEAAGATFIGSEDALTHPGSVGRAGMGVIRICDEAGAEVPTGEVGLVYFERETPAFEYHNDPVKTASAYHPDHPGDHRRHGLRRRRGFSLPHRSQGVHDHLGRSEHLPARGRERHDQPSGRLRRRGDRRPRRRSRRGGQGVRATGPRVRTVRRTRRGAARLRPGFPRRVQVAPYGRFRRRTTAHPNGQAGERPTAQGILAVDRLNDRR